MTKIPQQEQFRSVVNGKQTDLFNLSDGKGLQAYITNYGAKIVSLFFRDKNGVTRDLVLGHNSLKDYIHSEEQYFGAICGRYANRISKGQFSIDGIQYKLAINNGPNALHGGLEGFNVKVWDVEHVDEHSLSLSYLSRDGEEGYPGNLKIKLKYTLEENILRIEYEAQTDKKTVLNLTNHSYFNLSGEGDPSIEDHILKINAGTFLPTDETAIPYGAAAEVAGTPMDFRIPSSIGSRIDEKMDQLVWARGYDHTYVINKPLFSFGLHAEVHSPKTGIKMEVHSSEPGMQLYTGNWMTGNMIGKNGHRYPVRSAVCFETQHYPDSPNRAEYPSTLLKPGETFKSCTEYRFSIVDKVQ